MIKKGKRALAEALKATAETYLPDILTAVAAAWNNDVPLDPPIIYYAELQESIPEPLTLEVDMGNARQNANSANTSVYEGFGDVYYDFAIIINLAGDEVTTLIQRGEMYEHALWELLMKHQKLDGSDSVSGLTGINPTTAGRQFSTTNLAKFQLTVGWRGTMFVMQSVG